MAIAGGGKHAAGRLRAICVAATESAICSDEISRIAFGSQLALAFNAASWRRLRTASPKWVIKHRHSGGGLTLRAAVKLSGKLDVSRLAQANGRSWWSDVSKLTGISASITGWIASFRVAGRQKLRQAGHRAPTTNRFAVVLAKRSRAMI